VRTSRFQFFFFTDRVKTMDGLVKKSFSVNLYLMRVFGFYPSQSYKGLYKIYSYLVYCVFTILIPVLAAMDLLLGEDVDLAQISDNAFLVCQTGCFIIKLLPFVNNPDQIKKSIFMIENCLFNMYTKNQEEIIDECVATCRRNCRLFLSFCLLTLINWAITPFFIPGYHLPIEIWLPFDYKTSSHLYSWSFVFVVAGMSCVV
jgi:hypothetical protein